MNGVQIVIGNCFPEVHKVLPKTERKKFPIMVDDASCYWSCYTSTHASIWHRYGDMSPQR